MTTVGHTQGRFARWAATAKPDLMSVEEAKHLRHEDVADLMANYISPGQLRLLRLLGFDR